MQHILRGNRLGQAIRDEKDIFLFLVAFLVTFKANNCQILETMTNTVISHIVSHTLTRT